MVDFKKITDEDGFLFDPNEWTEEFAIKAATKSGIELTNDHWVVIKMIRDKYESSMRVPELRHILKIMKSKLGEDKATRKYVYQLFPYGYGQQGCLIAGMKQPKKLWLDL
jgi:tRNA 2-thiouridine synthesizing protein E|tara:strand:- start:3268 stop:3597 length:330 start_codon:yes stop_codon:yes gene_type:complete